MHRVRYLAAAGTMALASGLLFAGGPPPASPAATISIEPAMHSALASVSQPPTEAQCVATFTVPCYNPPQFHAAYDEQPPCLRGISPCGQTIVTAYAFGSRV